MRYTGGPTWPLFHTKAYCERSKCRMVVPRLLATRCTRTNGTRGVMMAKERWCAAGGDALHRLGFAFDDNGPGTLTRQNRGATDAASHAPDAASHAPDHGASRS
jgi:hypothetical protein